MKISVCLATYNGEKFIYEQLESILKQLNDNDEVIISDDYSTDKTIEIVKSFNDSRIRIIYNNSSRGYTANFENALLHVKGDIIFLSDQDDVWVDGKVREMCNILNVADLVVGDVEIVDVNLITIEPSHFKLHNVKKGFIQNFMFTRYIGASMAFRSEILKRALPFPKQKKNCAHDYWLTLIGEAYYKVELLEIPTLKYRRHGLNASTGGEKSTNTLCTKIINRAYSFIMLIGRFRSRGK